MLKLYVSKSERLQMTHESNQERYRTVIAYKNVLSGVFVSMCFHLLVRACVCVGVMSDAS